jgi:predicted RNA-binding Zn-ribbon protein involved in translation (DUF1610 family)
MTGGNADRHDEARANELYWGSELSVNQIAEELDLSKGTLYGLIRPRPTGLACPSCTEELVFPNRTARDRSLVACTACGWEGDREEADPLGGEAGVTPGLSAAPREPSYGGMSARSRTILGGALLGAAAGLAVTFWVRRR